MAVFLSNIYILLGLTACLQAENMHGIISLNTESFDKIVPKMKAVLVKFDVMFAHGGHHEVFKILAKKTAHLEDFFLAQVEIDDYHEWKDTQNAALGQRFNLHKHQFPAYKLFLQEQEEPIDYKGPIKNPDAFIKFIMQEAGIGIGLAACIEEFDHLAEKFLKAEGDKKVDIIQRAQKLSSEITNNRAKKARAVMYVKLMDKIMEKGDDFIELELERLGKLEDGWLSDKKMDQIKERVQIASKFLTIQKQIHLASLPRRDEL